MLTTGVLDPAATAWLASGSPDTGLETDHHGPCARCLRPSALTKSQRVISTQFTAYDTWADAAGRGLCPACTWVYRDKTLRARPHLVTREPVGLSELTLPQLRAHLSGPLNTNEAVSAPLRAGRRHVLPTAMWGRVGVDGTPLPWTRSDAALLDVVEQLRGWGFSWLAFTGHAPPWAPLSRLAPAQQAQALADWAQLAPWRDPTRSLWLRLALLATTPEADT